VYSQKKRDPNFSRLHIGIGYLPVLHFSPQSSDYKPSEFLRLTIGSNYEKGHFKLNLQYTNMVSSYQQPNCLMLDNSLSYLYDIGISQQFYIFSGLQIGLNTIHFYGSKVDDGRSIETEVSGGLEAGIAMRVIPKLDISVSYKLQRIFATPRNTLSMIDIGVVYYFNSSERLKKWLE
jgi:hypothetical protein